MTVRVSPGPPLWTGRLTTARPYKIFYADVAQLVEQLICNQLVAGSSPVVSSISGVSEEVITMVCLTIITGSIPVRLAISLGIPLKTRGSL